MHKKTILIVLIPFILTLSAGCASNTGNLPKADVSTRALALQPPSEYMIQPGDQLDIKLFYNPEFNESLTVRPDGKISMQLIDEIQASGLSPAQLDELLTEKYAKELKKPAVTVIVKSFSTQRVYVGGEVNRQGFVSLTAGMTPLQAVLEAGGIKETGDLGAAILIRKGLKNQPIPFRVDLENSLYGDGRGILQLHPLDVVYVPKTAIAEANKFVKQYIQDLLMFRGVSLGFSYELNPNVNISNN